MDCDELRLLGRLCSHFFLLFFFFSHLSGFGACFHLLNGNFCLDMCRILYRRSGLLAGISPFEQKFPTLPQIFGFCKGGYCFENALLVMHASKWTDGIC